MYKRAQIFETARKVEKQNFDLKVPIYYGYEKWILLINIKTLDEC